MFLPSKREVNITSLVIVHCYFVCCLLYLVVLAMVPFFLSSRYQNAGAIGIFVHAWN